MFKIKDCKKFMKKCNNCGEVKIINKFYRKRSNKDGYFKICTSCYRKRYKHICITCKKEFSSSNKHQKFCSKKCEGINNRGENNPNYKNAKLYIGANHPSWKGEIFITTVSIVVNNIIVSSLHMIKENIIFVVKNVNGNGKVKI